MKQDVHLRALMFVLAFTVAAAAQEQPPRFQTTVDVTATLEVTVVDNNGQPITGLGRGDFNVKIDGQERRVLSAEWVPVVENAQALAGDLSVPEGYSSNENTGGGRLIASVPASLSVTPEPGASVRVAFPRNALHMMEEA